MLAHVRFEDFTHEGVHCAASGSDALKDVAAFVFILKCALYGFNLTADAVHAM